MSTYAPYGKENDTMYMRQQAQLLAVSFKVRAFNILAGLVCAVLLRVYAGLDIQKEVFIVCGLWLFISLAYMAVFASGIEIHGDRQRLTNIHFSYYLPGALCATALAYYLAGMEWLGIFVYFFDLIFANMLFTRTRGLFTTAYIALCYLGMIYLEKEGMLPHFRVSPKGPVPPAGKAELAKINLFITCAIFFLVSYGSGFFARLREAKEKDVLASNERFGRKVRQFEKITGQLRKQISENRYMKDVAADYIAEKERELETVRKDLEGQVEKLRKTQKSMFFMIEDLNDMSAQLKDARDHLEEKVRERTDELLAVNRKLQRTERLAFLGKLASGVTHELRNPIAVIKNAIYFLEKKFKKEDAPKIIRYMEIIKKEIVVIDTIIDDIMGFARARIPQLRESDLREIVENVILTLNIPEGIRVEKDFGDIPEIEADSAQLMHAVTNIANNAIMAMKGEGVLTFRVFRKGGDVCIEVEDTGPGIPQEDQELIFEALYTSKPKGTGLGLPISKMMVESQDGTIELRSGTSKGTIFRISMPERRASE